jgi:hypothetical protein
MNLRSLAGPTEFEKLCRAVLAEEFSRFQAFSGPDHGLDGYDSDSKTIFQFYFPERSPRRDKILKDLEKVALNRWPCEKWVLLLPKDPSAELVKWLDNERARRPFKIEVWGETRVSRLLRKNPQVREQFFPTELRKELRRLVKGRRPKAGDAQGEDRISPEMAADLRQLILGLAEEEAERRKRKVQQSDYSREYSEFNAHFQLSSYDRLSTICFGEARTYLENKRYGRRQAETAAKQRQRYVAGIKAIQKDLKINEREYRRLLLEIGGEQSTTLMSLATLQRVFEHFRHLQGHAIAHEYDTIPSP